MRETVSCAGTTTVSCPRAPNKHCGEKDILSHLFSRRGGGLWPAVAVTVNLTAAICTVTLTGGVTPLLVSTGHKAIKVVKVKVRLVRSSIVSDFH